MAQRWVARSVAMPRANVHSIEMNLGSHTAPGAAQGWHVYVLLCADGTLYTGCTTDVSRRLREHNESTRGAKYTRSRRPVTLLRSWPHSDRGGAQREEARIKRLTRAQKLQLVAEGV